MLKLAWNNNFEKSLKKYLKKHPEKEPKIKERLTLFTREPFSSELRNHKLSGKLKDLRAIVVEYDCRIGGGWGGGACKRANFARNIGIGDRPGKIPVIVV